VSAGPQSRADERLAGLVRLARVMAEARTLLELAERVAEEARFAFGARTVSLSKLEPEHGRVRTLVNVGHLAPDEDRLPADETYEISSFPLLATMVDEARPWRVDVADPACDAAERDLLLAIGASSALAAPVLAEGRVWGELFATRGAAEPGFDDDDLAYAQAFAGMVSAGLAQVEHLATVERMAYRDPLTGLGNRRLVEEELEKALAEQRGGLPPVTLVMADVNRLKQANDEYGHEAGDRALVAVATALSLATGKIPGAVAGRVGGDEFCAVLPGYGLPVGEALASAFLRGAASAPYGVSVACGVASSELAEGDLTAARLFALADAAQYQAKRAGATHPVIASPESAGGERRSNRGRTEQPPLLAAVLQAMAEEVGSPPMDRLVVAAAALSTASGGIGWVLSRLRGGAALPVEHDVRRDGVFVASVPAPASAPWLVQARAQGVVVRANDPDLPLAAVRGCAQVVVAAAGDWLVEVLSDSPTPPDVAAVLRAAMGVALAG
jgi:diguanylate cyclase (GGDEF)-like protein